MLNLSNRLSNLRAIVLDDPANDTDPFESYESASDLQVEAFASACETLLSYTQDDEPTKTDLRRPKMIDGCVSWID